MIPQTVVAVEDRRRQWARVGSGEGDGDGVGESIARHVCQGVGGKCERVGGGQVEFLVSKRYLIDIDNRLQRHAG